MLNATTGQLVFHDGDIVITPELTRDEFLATSWGESAEHWVTNEPWHAWRLKGTIATAGTEAINLIVILFFHGQALQSVELCDSDDKYGTSWDDHSMEKEMLRKQSHDAWLDACIGSEREFTWGRVFSEYDQKAGSSGIVIKYQSS